MAFSNGKKVLVVEDHLDTQLLMRHVLKNEGYGVSVAGTASEAFQLLETETPDIVLLDLTLPGMTGEEFMAKLRGNAQWSDLKVIIISGWDDLKERATAVGANGYLRKPFQIAQFYSQLELIVRPPSNENPLSF